MEMMSSPENTDLLDSLRVALGRTINGIITTSGREQAASLLTQFEIIQNLTPRFWTKDFLDDLLNNVGSGVYLGSTMICDFSRRFYSQMAFINYQRRLANPSVGFFNPHDLIEMVAGIVNNELLSTELARDGRIVGLLDVGTAEYYSSLKTDHRNEDEVVSFLEVNNWLIPFYMLFATEAYESTRAALDKFKS